MEWFVNVKEFYLLLYLIALRILSLTPNPFPPPHTHTHSFSTFNSTLKYKCANLNCLIAFS